MKLDLIFTGVGGQGILVSSDIFCEAALIDGFDVAKTETRGMAQRGGSIISHVRIGDEVSTPLIEEGTGDLIVGFEILETARALPILKRAGTVLLNVKFIPLARSFKDSASRISPKDLLTRIENTTNQLYKIDGSTLAKKIGNSIVLNIILLGALSALPENPVNIPAFEKVIKNHFKKQYVSLNLNAFKLGREYLLDRSKKKIESI